MEEYDVMENSLGTDTGLPENFQDTVSGNDAGTDAAASGQENTLPEEGGQEGQGELLESLNALVEILTPSEEEAEIEGETEAEAEAPPSETETAILELLEKIYAETSAGKTADILYYEAWAESRTEMQAEAEKAEQIKIYMTAVQIGMLFLVAVIAGIEVAGMIWRRFK